MCIVLSMLFVNTLTAQVTSENTDSSLMSVQLHKITVKNTPSSSRMILASLPVSAVSLSDLQASSSNNIINALCQQPGVSELTTGTGISKPVIRGLGYNRIAVINDGVRQEGNQWGDEHGIEIDGNSVDSVEIIKGPSSLRYGSDAMAGVVIMHDTKLSENGFRGKVSSEYQSNNGLAGGSVRLGYGKNDMFVDGQLSAKAAHDYQNSSDGFVPNTGYTELAGKLRGGFEKKWGHTYITTSFFGLTPEITEGERDTITGELESESNDRKSYQVELPFQKVNHYKAIAENAVFLPSGMLKTIVGYQLNSRQEFEESKDECELHFMLHTVNYDLHFHSLKKNQWQYSYGVNGMFQNSQNQGEEVLIPEFRLFDAGLYAMASKELEHWSFNGGVRYDMRHVNSDEFSEDGALRFVDFTRTFNSISGSFGTICNVNDALALRLNLARGFRAPNMSELASNGVHEGTIRYELGDNTLNPEYSLQADFGIDVNYRFVTAQAEVFANRISDYIFSARSTTVIDPEFLTYQYRQGDAFLAGGEVRADVRATDWLKLGSSFSYVQGTLLTTDDYLPKMPPMEVTGYVTATAQKQWSVFNKASLSCNVKHYFDQDRFYDVDNTETETPHYTLLSLSAGVDVVSQKRTIAEIHLIADNLFDVAYQSHLSRLKYTDVNVVTGHQGVYNMGRNVTVKLVFPIQ